nr:N-(5'-phosphoribosyl)anthranilate isomerase [Gammaproteobacteria bacterium]
LGKLGGTGKTFDWDLLSGLSNIRVILAGGLNESNVQKAIRQVRPYAVDLSSGVEVEKGIKDATKIQILTELVYQT